MRGSRAVNTEPHPPSPAQATQAGWGCTPLPVGGPSCQKSLLRQSHMCHMPLQGGTHCFLTRVYFPHYSKTLEFI